MFGECAETVSIVHAAVFGADGACIELSVASILTAFGAFMVFVIIAQFFARLLWRKLWQRSAPIEDTFIDPISDTPFQDDPKYRDSAIRSTKR